MMPRDAVSLAPAVLTVAMVLCFAPACSVKPERPAARADVNDNRLPAGHLEGGVLTIDLVASPARWFPESDDGPYLTVFAFSEEGKSPSVPGPMIRVNAGTEIRARIRNALPDSATLTLHGFHTRPRGRGDTLRIPAGETGQASFLAGEPGTYFYAGTTSGHGLTEPGESPVSSDDSQLHGAFIVDPAGTTSPPSDRVFVMGRWGIPPDTTGPPPIVAIDVMTINGKSWPHTERLTMTAGDTVRWRWLNPTVDAHPMHLHGFYFDVESRGSWAADTVYAPGDTRQAVTELMLPGGTMQMKWVPVEPGNWLFHCHFAFHVSHYLSVAKVPDATDPLGPGAMDHTVEGMRGLVLGITVESGASRARRPETYGSEARQLRLLVQAAPRRFDDQEGLGYLIDDGGTAPARDSVPSLSPALVLRRGEPVNITVVNHLRAPTGVHWHGMELPSYPDGVPGWSGTPGRLAPSIAPADSFVAAFTPPRAGTFIYHSHSNEAAQIASGLYGPLIVVDPERGYHPERERVFVVGGNGPLDVGRGRVNGKLEPDTVEVTAGRAYRFRLIHINPDWRVWMSLRDGAGQTLTWRALAKDGADLPASQSVLRPARMLAGPGETADFEFTPVQPGLLAFEATGAGDAWTVRVPIRVRPTTDGRDR